MKKIEQGHPPKPLLKRANLIEFKTGLKGKLKRDGKVVLLKNLMDKPGSTRTLDRSNSATEPIIAKSGDLDQSIEDKLATTK